MPSLYKVEVAGEGTYYVVSEKGDLTKIGAAGSAPFRGASNRNPQVTSVSLVTEHRVVILDTKKK